VFQAEVFVVSWCHDHGADILAAIADADEGGIDAVSVDDAFVSEFSRCKRN
jgi:hypothetical protein